MGDAVASHPVPSGEGASVVASPSPVPEILTPRLPARIPSLDGLRAISIAMVLVAHMVGDENIPPLLHQLHHLGNFGVKVFFVISGFLITTLLIKEFEKTGGISLKGFYIRRVFRIFPAFYTYFFIIVALSWMGYLTLKPGDAVHAATFTMNYHHDRAWYLNHTWSLSVEEQFYLLWPPLMVWLGTRKALAVALVTILFSPAARAYMLLAMPPNASALTREFQAVADALATGCLLAGAYNRLGESRRYLAFLKSPWFLLVPSLGMGIPLAFYKVDPGFYYVFGQSIANIAIALCVDRGVRLPSDAFGRLINTRPFVFAGVLSYSLYLWQEPFFNPSSSYNAGGLFYKIPLVIIASIASFYLVERPFLHLRSVFQNRCSK
jgi:peptidoglycan/LPS O-acetylase OafA/YrhL